MTSNKLSRRDLLKLAGVTAATAVGLQVANKALSSESVPAGTRQWAMVIDQNKCTGCGYCIMACRAHNDVSPDITWNPVIESGRVGEKQVYLPRPCMQCAKAPCVDVCPVGASYHRPDGIVMMDYDRCIGCRYCEVACPYGARSPSSISWMLPRWNSSMSSSARPTTSPPFAASPTFITAAANSRTH
jgi:Fe-S-cluster-containing hydrogenase component 2